jgi:DNA-binding IclR family transcriptional regulator
MKKTLQTSERIPLAAASVSPQEGKETSSIKRVLLLLQCLVDNPGESAQMLAARLNLPRSTVHRLLTTLRTNDFALSESGGVFTPGIELYRMAGKLGAQMPYAMLAQPYLEKLSARFGETSLLTLLERHQLKMFHAANGVPADPMRYNIRLNALEPLIWGATARVVLAYLRDEEIEAAIAGAGHSPVAGWAPDETEIRGALKTIRDDGYAVTHSHRTANAVGVAAPFFKGDGQVAGSMGFLVPESRWADAEQDTLIEALRVSAQALSRQLGYSAPVPR